MSEAAAASLTTDLGLLRGMTSTAQATLRQIISTPANTPQSAAQDSSPNPPSALKIIDSFRPTTSSMGSDSSNLAERGEEAQLLARAYLRDMNAVKEQNDGRLDTLGQRIEDVRDRATRVSEALGEVRV